MDTALFPLEARYKAFQNSGNLTTHSDPKINRDGVIAFWAEVINSSGVRKETIHLAGPNHQTGSLPDDFTRIFDFDISDSGVVAVSGYLPKEDSNSKNTFFIQKYDANSTRLLSTLLEDSYAPTAGYAKSDGIGAGQPFTTFRFDFYDDLAIDLQSLIDNPIYVQGPNGFLNVTTRAISVDNGRHAIVHFEASAPGGFWDDADNGQYRFIMPSGIKDISGKSIDGFSGTSTFTVNFPDGDYHRVDKDHVPGGVTILDNTIYDLQRTSTVRFADLSSLREGLYPGGFNRISLNDSGEVAFTYIRGTNFSRPTDLLGVWNGQSDGVSIIDYKAYGEDLEFGNNGNIAVATTNRISVYNQGLNLIGQVGSSSHFDRIGDIDLSSQGDVLAFSASLTADGKRHYGNRTDARGRYGTYGVFAAVIDGSRLVEYRLMGVENDGVLDPGEQDRYGLDSGPTSFRSIQPTVSVASNLSGDRSFHVAFSAGGIYSIKAYVNSQSRILANPALLISSANDLPKGIINGGVALAIDQAGTFHYAWVRGKGIRPSLKRKGFEYVAAEYYSAKGKMPKLTRKLGTGATHINLEKFARGVGYWDFFNHTTVFERGQVLDNSYVISTGFHDGNSGFQALELLPYARMRSNRLDNGAVLVFRGTEFEPLRIRAMMKDVMTDIDPANVGAYQYRQMVETLRTWVKRVHSTYDQKVTLTGHSLAGALAQLFGARFTASGTGIAEGVTFNSPGLTQKSLRGYRAHRAGRGFTHYISSGDIISLAGESFLDGKAYLVQYVTGISIKKIALNKHTLPMLADKVLYDNKGKVDYKRAKAKRTKRRLAISVLNHPYFNYADDPNFNVALNSLRKVNVYGQQLAMLLRHRQGVEYARRKIGAYKNAMAWYFRGAKYRSWRSVTTVLPRVPDFSKLRRKPNWFRFNYKSGQVKIHRSLKPKLDWMDNQAASKYQVEVVRQGRKKKVAFRRTTRGTSVDLNRKLKRGDYTIRLRMRVRGKWTKYQNVQKMKIV